MEKPNKLRNCLEIRNEPRQHRSRPGTEMRPTLIKRSGGGNTRSLFQGGG